MTTVLSTVPAHDLHTDLSSVSVDLDQRNRMQLEVQHMEEVQSAVGWPTMLILKPEEATDAYDPDKVPEPQHDI